MQRFDPLLYSCVHHFVSSGQEQSERERERLEGGSNVQSMEEKYIKVAAPVMWSTSSHSYQSAMQLTTNHC